MTRVGANGFDVGAIGDAKKVVEEIDQSHRVGPVLSAFATANDVLGYPDDLKLRSSATLFAQVSPSHSVFHRILDKYFDGRPDEATLRLIEA